MKLASTRNEKVRQPMSFEKRRRVSGTLFILPWLIGLIVFFLRPILYSIYYSLSNLTFEGGLNTEFIGLQHYASLLFSNTVYLPKMLDAVRNLFLTVPLILAFSLFIALLLNQKFIGRSFARALFFLPVIVASGIVITLLKQDAFANSMMQENVNTTLFGATGLNTLLLRMNLPNNIVTSLVGIVNNIFDLVWQSSIQMLLFLSGLQGIPKAFYEAAHIEGANAWLSFWKITFPTLMPTMLVAIVYSVIDSFTHYANPMMQLIHDTYTKNMNYAYASAMSWGYFLVVMVVLGLVFFVVGRRVQTSD